MAKTRSQPQEAPRRRDPRGGESDRWNRTLIIGAVVAVVLIALGVIGFGWYQTQIKPLSKTVLRVEDIKFDLGHLERRMRLEREQNPSYAQGGNALLALPDNVLAQLEREAKLLERAGDLDITVTDEDVAAEIRERGGLAEDVDPDIFASTLRQQVEDSGLRRDEYEQMLRAELLEERAINYFSFLGPTEEPQVRGRLIFTEDEERAQEARQRVLDGEDFETVGTEISPTGSALEIDWTPRGGSPVVLEDVEDFLFGSEPGAISNVIEAGGFYYVAELQEKDEDRELSEQHRDRLAQIELGEWLEDLDGSLTIERDFTQDDALRALEDIL